MLKKWMSLGVLGGFLFLVACSGEESKDEQSSNKEGDNKEEKVEECTFMYDPASTVVGWTGFKFTEKTGVPGNFDRITVENVQNGNIPYEVLKNASFIIPVSSTNTKNPDRDMKIKNQFFGTMMDTETIEGKITSWEEGSGQAMLMLNLNGKEQEVEVNMMVEGEKVTLATTIDVASFNAQASVDSLNAVCKDLHTGADGVSKLWSEVDIKVETTLKKECN